MPGTSDDDIFKRMFASFVARKTRSNTIPPSSTQYAHHMHRPDSLSRLTADANARRFPPDSRLPHPPNPISRQLHQPVHVANKHTRNDTRPTSPFPSLFKLRSITDTSRNAPLPSFPLTRPRAARSSKASRGSKGSKGSEKPISASTEDAPPRKRTRVHPASLQRTQSAHASLIIVNGKTEKVKTPSRVPSITPAATSPSPLIPLPSKISSAKATPAVKSFPCDKCSATFAQKGQLSRHIRRVHEKLRPHACEFCGRLFGARSDRTRHVTIVHKKVRQFPCDRCGFLFQAKTHLEAHIRTVHDGARPFRCDQCGFSFGLRSNLLTHERAVHYREAKWSCSVCETAFNRKHDMFRHMKLMHDIDSSAASGSLAVSKKYMTSPE